MTEQKLKEYFEFKLTAEQLALDLKESQQKSGYDTKAVYIQSIKKGKFEISKEHVIMLLDDTLDNKLRPIDLNTVAFALMGSDFFKWDEESEEGERMSTVIFELDNPDLGFDLTFKNLQLWKEYLITGEYRLDKYELKQKFRSNVKNKELYQKIDDILWKDWDPLEVNEIASRSEYQRYTPIIFNLNKKKAGREVIAQKLYEFETQNLGLLGNLDNCRKVANKTTNLHEKKKIGT